jgi:hypothetical protein
MTMAQSSAERQALEDQEYERNERKRLDQVEKDMDADAFVVVAPMVMLKVRNDLGVWHFRGFNEGGRFRREDIEEGSLRHHLDGAMVAPVDSPAARYAGPSGTPKPGEPPNVPLTEEPVTTVALAERLKRQAKATEDAKADEAKAKPAADAKAAEETRAADAAKRAAARAKTADDAKAAAEAKAAEEAKAAAAKADS